MYRHCRTPSLNCFPRHHAVMFPTRHRLQREILILIIAVINFFLLIYAIFDINLVWFTWKFKWVIYHFLSLMSHSIILIFFSQLFKNASEINLSRVWLNKFPCEFFSQFLSVTSFLHRTALLNKLFYLQHKKSNGTKKTPLSSPIFFKWISIKCEK